MPCDPPETVAKDSAYLLSGRDPVLSNLVVAEIASFDRAIDRVPAITRIEP